jgi:hypothetical protein
MKKSKDELLALIDRMREAVAADDSFEGSLSYTAMADGLERHEFEVAAGFRIGNSQGQGGMVLVTGQPDPVASLETPRMLVLSTGHIEYRTSLRLDGKRSGRAPLHYKKGEHGWIIPIIPFENGDEEERWAWTPDLQKIRRFAEENGCTWIMLDQAADTIEALPVYDW